MDGYLDLLDQLDDLDENLRVHIQRVGKGEWRIETREGLIDEDVRAQLDLPPEQARFDDLEGDVEAD